MSARSTACPSCGAPIKFQVSTSFVVVCEYCSTLVARGDVKPENLGKVGQLAASGSPLSIGLEGRWNGKGFRITGQARFNHPMGGTWDEYYASFEDGRWGWIAEAQGGRIYLTFEEPDAGRSVPPHAQLNVGAALQVGGKPYVIAERTTATTAGMQGELPYRPAQNGEHPFADLSGPGGAFGTIDYRTRPASVYLGHELTLDDLGVADRAPAQERGPRAVDAAKLACPQCGGPLKLRAPEAQRVTCPQCSSLLDVNEQRELRFLEQLSPRTGQIEIGAEGDVRGARCTVLGMLERSTVIDGERWTWEEYLLYDKKRGSRWLVFSDNDWSYVTPIGTGDVREVGRGARYKGQQYRQSQRSRGRVEYVMGEFPWRVTVGETVEMADFECGRHRLSKEWSSDEVVWSSGEPISRDQIAKAFGAKAKLKGMGPLFGGPRNYATSGADASAGAAQIPPVVVIIVIILFIIFLVWVASESGGGYSGGGIRGSSGGFSFGSHGGK